MLDQLAKNIANRLAERNVKVLRIEEETDCTDTALWITEKIHIQVGYGYINVVREDDQGDFHFYDTHNRIDSIFSTLRKAIEDGK